MFSTFVASAVTEVEQNLTSAGSIIAISTVFKILNAFLVITVFTFNGTVNDYFIGFFFLVSS